MGTIERGAVAAVVLSMLSLQVAMYFNGKDIKADIAATNTAVGVVTNEIKTIKKTVADLEKVVLYKSKEKLNVSDKDLQCLAKNIFHEAGIEGRTGKVAVAQVTLNRLKSKRWGSSLCSVVHAKAQFSWTLSKKLVAKKPSGQLWEESLVVANQFVKGHRIQGLETSGFYHTDYIKKPNWAKGKTVALVVGQHIFYKGVDS